jgi:hypothetical protein
MKSWLFRAALVMGTFLIVDEAVAAEKWKWSLTPYFWLTDLGVDVEINDRQVVDTEIDVKDLAEDLTLTFQVHAEGQRGMNGLLLDLYYVKLEDDPKTVAVPPPPGGTAVLDTEIHMTILEAGGIFDAKGDEEGFQLLYGARIIDQQAEIDTQFTPAAGPATSRRFDPSDTAYDGLAGVRWIKKFGHGWSTSLRGDVSAGGTALAWNVNATAAWSFGKGGRFAITGGYRRMEIQFKEEDSVESEMVLSGPILGFRFLF